MENTQIDPDFPLTPDRIPLDIPDDTKVPPWASLNVTVCARLIGILVSSLKTEQVEDKFNLTAARAVAGMCYDAHLSCTLFDRLSYRKFERFRFASVDSNGLRPNGTHPQCRKSHGRNRRW